MSSFADRAEAVRNGNVNPRFDNMLKITNDGPKNWALDPEAYERDVAGRAGE